MGKLIVNKELSIIDIKKKYRCSRATAYRAKRRGYTCQGYHKKTICPILNLSNFPVDAAKIAALTVLKNNCWQNKSQDKEDLMQEAILRCLELSGISVDLKFMFSVAKNAMRNFTSKQKKHCLYIENNTTSNQ